MTQDEGYASLDAVPLACPIDKKRLSAGTAELHCPDGHRYPVVDGVPILLRRDLIDSHPYFEESRLAAEKGRDSAETHGGATSTDGVDSFVQQEIVKTNGLLYKTALGALMRYPIPEIPLPDAMDGARLLDVGCNWGRWSIAASRKGYRVIGIDPGLAAIQAAYRVSGVLNQAADFLVGDGRSLPFPDASFDVVFSYSVLQHFPKEDVRISLREAARVVRPGGTVLIQLANLFGVRQLYNQIRDTINREQNPFRVRRWTPGEMLSTFNELVGPARLTADGFFSLNAQPTDLDLLATFPGMIVRSSQTLKGIARRFHPLALLADSVFIEATRA